MSQPPQPAYGGRPFGGYNAPPPSNYPGYPPSSPQQEPSRFGYGAGAPPQGQPQYPPGGNPAFFMVPPGEQRAQQQTPQAGPPAGQYGVPDRVPVGRPQSYAPQELSTGHYDSPVDNHQSFSGPGQPQGAPSAPPGYEQQQPGGYPPQNAPSQQQNPYDQITSPPPATQKATPSKSASNNSRSPLTPPLSPPTPQHPN